MLGDIPAPHVSGDTPPSYAARESTDRRVLSTPKPERSMFEHIVYVSTKAQVKWL